MFFQSFVVAALALAATACTPRCPQFDKTSHQLLSSSGGTGSAVTCKDFQNAAQWRPTHPRPLVVPGQVSLCLDGMLPIQSGDEGSDLLVLLVGFTYRSECPFQARVRGYGGRGVKSSQ
ncbi:hypothetical protein B0H14DRAFT_2640179 [Mycena olivaceomarginata]|nr:hypothetical protein B0H14DRAFT_2640179 [Mycena olivaceomarginata]